MVADTERSEMFQVNFSAKLLLLYQEVHCAFQCGIRIPSISAFVYARRNQVLHMRDQAQVLTNHN